MSDAAERAVTHNYIEYLKIPRGQKRYRQWLGISDVGVDISFGQWLREGCPGERSP